MYRKFEGEADRSHHGPAPNGLYSTAHNMRTWISEGKVRLGGGGSGSPSGCGSGLADDVGLQPPGYGYLHRS